MSSTDYAVMQFVLSVFIGGAIFLGIAGVVQAIVGRTGASWQIRRK